jgi:hypothetical protein
MKEKKCLECSDNIRGRSDKKFCTDMCRNAYNNRLRTNTFGAVRRVNSILARNRKILSKLTKSRATRVDKENLLEYGFHFGYFTSTYTTKKGEVFYYCYEYGFQLLSGGQISLVKKQEIDAL